MLVSECPLLKKMDLSISKDSLFIPMLRDELKVRATLKLARSRNLC